MAIGMVMCRSRISVRFSVSNGQHDLRVGHDSASSLTRVRFRVSVGGSSPSPDGAIDACVAELKLNTDAVSCIAVLDSSISAPPPCIRRSE